MGDFGKRLGRVIYGDEALRGSEMFGMELTASGVWRKLRQEVGTGETSQR